MRETHYISVLSAFIDRELSKEEQQTVGEHLMVCAACRREHDRIRIAAGFAAHIERTDAPKSVWTRIEGELQKATAFEIPRSSRRYPAIVGYVAAAVFAVVFVALGYSFLSGGKGGIDQARIESAPQAGDPATAQRAPDIQQIQPANTALPVTGSDTTANVETRATAVQSAGSFEFETIAGKPTVGSLSTASSLSVGDYLETDSTSKALIEVANIGNVEVRPNSRVKLVRTSSKEHRIALERGSLHAKIFAPPRLFIVDTPSATAVDLGCEYTLDVDEAGNNRLHVTSGFVALEAGRRESIVPAGAVCLTRKGKGLGTPYSAETSETFRGALERFDFGGGGSRSVDSMLSSSTFYDMISLWHLLSRVDRVDRGRIYDTLARYVAPPDDVSRDGIIALDKRMLEAWRQEVERAWFE